MQHRVPTPLQGGYARLLDYAIPPDTLTLKEIREEAVRLDSELEKHYGLIEFPVQSFLQNFHKHVLLSIHDISLSKKTRFFRSANYKPRLQRPRAPAAHLQEPLA